MAPDVIDVGLLGGTRLELTFSNGEVREVDVAELASFDGVFQELRAPEFFNKVYVHPELGTIVWPNGADLCPDVLYERSVPVASRA